MKKQFTVEEIAAHLQNTQSFDYDDIPRGTGRYWLHVTEDGELTGVAEKSVVTFSSDHLHISEAEKAYISLCEEKGWSLAGLASPACIYDTEDLKYEHFRRAVESLTEQVNEWLAEQEDDE